MRIKFSQLAGLNEIILYLLFFLTPLTFVFITRELFEFPKMILVYFLAVVLGGVFLLGKAAQRSSHDSSLRAFFLLAAVVAISSFLSVNRYTSFFGYYSRFNGGLASYLAFGVILASAALFLNKRTVASCLNALLVSGILVSFYALLQNLGVDKNFWVQDSQARAFSTLGQPNWLAAYLLVIFPLPFYEYLNAEALAKKILFLAVIVLYYFAFWATYSLSGFLGLLVFGLLFLFGSFSVVKAKWKELLLLGFFCLAVSFARPGIFGAKFKSFLQIIGPSISITHSALAAPEPPATPKIPPKGIDTADIRLGVWPGALRLWLSSPKNFLIGTGPETFAYTFLPFRSLSLNKTTEWDFLYNKAHNYYLDVLAGTGLLGLLAVAFFSFTAAKVVLKSSGRTPASLGRLMIYGWATIFVTNFFGWPTVVLSLLFFLYPLLAGRLEIEEKESEEKINLVAGRTLVIFGVCLFLIVGVVNIFLADVSFTQGYAQAEGGLAQLAETPLKDAIRLNPWEPAYHKELAYVYAQKYVEAEDETDLNLALKEARTAYNLNPKNSLTLRSLIRVYYLLSKVKPEYKVNLEKLALDIIKLSPTEPRSYYDAALMFYYSGDKEAARELNDEAIKLRPGYPEALELTPKLETTPSTQKK